MPADVFGARFYGHRVPAWHRLGRVSNERIGAVEALRLAGPYEVVLEPSTEPGRSEIIRLPTSDEPRRRSFGVVGNEYVLVPPAEITTIWDESVRRPVETLGALHHGRCLFLTLDLGTFEVRGDPVRNYLVLAHWMAADHSSVAFVSPVRVVCSNTLRLAERMSQVRVDLAPTGGVRERIAEHLQRAVSRTQRQSILIRSAFERLAARTVDATEAASVLAATYPNDDGSLRRAALHLFHGAGRGMDHPAARGTLWGLYNAIAELENFHEDGTDTEAASEILFGGRAAAMRRAFDAVQAVCAMPRSPQTNQLDPVRPEVEALYVSV